MPTTRCFSDLSWRWWWWRVRTGNSREQTVVESPVSIVYADLRYFTEVSTAKLKMPGKVLTRFDDEIPAYSFHPSSDRIQLPPAYQNCFKKLTMERFNLLKKTFRSGRTLLGNLWRFDNIHLQQWGGTFRWLGLGLLNWHRTTSGKNREGGDSEHNADRWLSHDDP